MNTYLIIYIVDVVYIYLQYWQKSMYHMESTMETLVFNTLIFSGNVWSPTTNKNCHFKTNVMCSVVDEKLNFQCLKLMIYHRMYSDMSFINNSSAYH